MATVTGLTAERMQEIEAASVVDGEVIGDNLILTKHDGSTTNAGSVRGPQGDPGPADNQPEVDDLSTHMAVIKEGPRNITYPEFGAVNGTDSTAAINAALAAGGVILVPEGEFRHGIITQKPKTKLKGLGRGISILKQIDAGGTIRNEHYLDNGTNVDDHMGIESLTIDGNRAAHSPGNWFGLLWANASDSTIDDVEFLRCYRTGCRLGGDASGAMGAADRINIEKSRFSDAGGLDGLGASYGVGLSILRGQRIDVDACFMDNNLTHGYDAEPNSSSTYTLRDVNVRASHAHNNGQGGFVVYNSSTTTQDTELVSNHNFDLCHSYLNAQDGFRVFGHRDVTISRAKIYSNTLDAVRVDNYNRGFRLLDSLLRNSGQHGIQFTSQLLAIGLLRGNRFIANAGWGAIVPAARTTFWLDLISNRFFGNVLGGKSFINPSTNGRILDNGDNLVFTAETPTGLGPWT